MKKTALVLISIVAIFLSYYYIFSIDKRMHQMTYDAQYSIDSYKNSPQDKHKVLHPSSLGRFFIDMSGEKSYKGSIKFKKDFDLMLFLFLENDDIGAKVDLNISVNNKEKYLIRATEKKKGSAVLSIKSGDRLDISAKEISKLKHNYIKIVIMTKESLPYTRASVIPIAWSLLFILFIIWGYQYVAISSYIIFLTYIFAEKFNFVIVTIEESMAYLALLFSLSFLLVWLYKVINNRYLSSLVSWAISVLISIIPLLVIIYNFNFDALISGETLNAIFQTNNQEAYEYISNFISIEYIAMLVAYILTIGFLLFKQSRVDTKSVRSIFMIVPSIIFAVITVANFSQLHLPYFIYNSIDQYKTELKRFQELKVKRESGDIKFRATKSKSGETYIVIIGESLNKKYMGIYGYWRDTTPNLSKYKNANDLVIFDNAYSNHTHTVPTLSYALTEANQYSKANSKSRLSIIDISKRAAFKTYWLSNQVMYGVWGSKITILASSADSVVSINQAIGEKSQSKQYDEKLIDSLKEILDTPSKKNRLIFIHLMGSHMEYENRYPKDKYTKFDGRLPRGAYGVSADSHLVNFYDNSVLYNDFVVSSIISELEKLQGVSGLLYLSDHAEAVVAENGHEANLFGFEMLQIPMIAWLSDGYKSRYPARYREILANSNKLYSNDMLYDTLVGFMDIDTDIYTPRFDITSSKYHLASKDALALHGKYHYTDRDNYIYWQRENSKRLIELNQSSRIFPMRVDTIGKLKEIYHDKIKSFEIDITYDSHTDKLIVSDGNISSQISLVKLISATPHQDIDRLILNLRDLSTENYQYIINRLELIDKELRLKERTIVEFSKQLSLHREFARRGWHSSYHIPTKAILVKMESNSRESLEKLSLEISKEIIENDLKDISFDSRLYDFVKLYIEPKIHSGLRYHTYIGLSLSDPDLIDRLKNRKFYFDDRIDTILITHKSLFNI